MKKCFLIAVSILFFQISFAQVKPIYFKGDEMTTDSAKATSYAVFGKLSNEDLWLIKRYNLYNDLMFTGSYRDDKLKIPHGKFTYYEDVEDFNDKYDTYYYFKDRYRFISGTGTFINGIQNGLWLTFYPDGKVFNSYNFVNDFLNGEFRKYDRKGKLEEAGNYVNGKRDGEWVFHGGLQKSVYKLDTLISTVKDKKLLRREYANPGFNNN